jgi:hypothetical protein
VRYRNNKFAINSNNIINIKIIIIFFNDNNREHRSITLVPFNLKINNNN